MILYFVVVAVLAAATIVEKWQGTEFVSSHFYGSWWFTALWALLAAFGVVWFIRSRVRRVSVVLLHASFVVILAGALLTHLTARRGIVLLRQGETQQQYMTRDMKLHTLPFAVRLESFEIRYYEGTDAPKDYVSHLVIDERPFTVSMNHIADYRGYRLYQSSYDEDLHGSVLSLNADPWGIPVTYTGYGMLFLSLFWVLIDPRGRYRQLLRRLSAVAVVVMMGVTAIASPRVLPAETAERFGRLFVVYNDRVCPMQTYALDFTRKLYGSREYQGYTAEQVLTGFIFYYDDWVREPMKQDGKPMKMRERQLIVEQLHQGTPVRVFPYADSDSSRIMWYAPTSVLPDSINPEHRLYIRELFTRLQAEAYAGRFDVVDRYLDLLLEYQYSFGGKSLPSPLQERAERFYNRGPLCALLLGIPLRWIITGTFPMSNGYETMLLLSLLVFLLSLVLWRRSHLLSALGLLLSGCFLLVAWMAQLDPVMTPLMPVLNSPLLSLHVSVLMMSYALLSLPFLCSLVALFAPRRRERMWLLSQLLLFPAVAFLAFGIFIGAIWANVSWGTYWSWDPKETWALITLMVYSVPLHHHPTPNTHHPSPNTQHPSPNTHHPTPNTHHPTPITYHLYILLSFLTLLMTYFGVNYFLGGMHSYA